MNLNVANVTFNHVDRGRRFVGVDMAATAFNHRGGIIDGDDTAVVICDVTAYGEGGRTE